MTESIREEGACISCDKITTKQVKSYETGYVWVFECEDCGDDYQPVVTEGYGDI